MTKTRKYAKQFALVVLATSVLYGCATNKVEPTPTDVLQDEQKVTGTADSFGQFHFDLGKSELKNATDGLSAISRVLHFHPESMVHLNGHADATGGDVKNLKLSEERVQAVVDALVTFGISRDRIHTDYFGEDRPVCDNTTEEGRACNRSVVVYIK